MGEHDITSGTTYAISVTVPAGSYDISGTASVDNWDATYKAKMGCILYAGTTDLTEAYAVTFAYDSATYGVGLASVALHASYTTATGTTFSLSCTGRNSSNEDVFDPALSAIKVGTLH